MYIIHNNTGKCVYFFKYNLYLQKCVHIHIYTSMHTYTCPPVFRYRLSVKADEAAVARAVGDTVSSPWAWPLRSCTPACTRVCARSSGPARLPSSTWGNVVFNPWPGGLKSRPHISFLATSRAGLPAAAQPLADWAEPPLAVSHTEQKLSPNTCSQNKFFFLFCTK